MEGHAPGGWYVWADSLLALSSCLRGPRRILWFFLAALTTIVWAEHPLPPGRVARAAASSQQLASGPSASPALATSSQCLLAKTKPITKWRCPGAGGDWSPGWETAAQGATCNTFLSHSNPSIFRRVLLVLKLIIKKKIVREQNALYMSWFFSLLSFQSALKEQPWKSLEGYNFFKKLDYLLRLLGENAKP